MNRLPVIATIAALLGLGLASGPAMAGSDSPTPYLVDRAGITYPLGRTLGDNGHINVRTADGQTFSIHAEGKCATRTDAECAGARHDAAQFIGTQFIPWSAFGVPATACVSWVQISDFNEHYGEGGQSAVCLTPTQEPTWTPSSSPTSTPTVEPSATPTPSEPASPTPTSEPSGGPSPTGQPSTSTVSPTPSPTSVSPSPSSTPSPSTSSTAVPSPTSSPTSRTTPPPSTASTPMVSATARTVPSPMPTSDVLSVKLSPVRPSDLAATGSNTTAALGVAVLVVVVGYVLYAAARRNR